MEEILNATSLTDCAKLEPGFGTRYSALACLPYFDTIRMSIILILFPCTICFSVIFLILMIICFTLIYFIQN